jgi:hypothetical protein
MNDVRTDSWTIILSSVCIMDYYNEYLEYKRKYIDLRDNVLVELQVGGGFFDSVSKWFRGKEEPKEAKEIAPVKIYPGVKQTLGKKTAAEWLYLKVKPSTEPFKIRSIIITEMNKPISEDMFDSMLQYTIDRTLTPKMAYEYLLNVNEKMDPQYLVNFLYNYINFAIGYGPDNFKKQDKMFNTETEYMIPMIKLLLMYREYGKFELDDTIQEFKKTVLAYEVEKLGHISDEYKKWVETLLNPGSYMPEIKPIHTQFGRMKPTVISPTLVKRPSSLPLPIKPIISTPVRPVSEPPSSPRTIQVQVKSEEQESPKKPAPMSSYRELPMVPPSVQAPTPPTRPPRPVSAPPSSPSTKRIQPPSGPAPTPLSRQSAPAVSGQAPRPQSYEQESLAPTFQAPTPPSSSNVQLPPLRPRSIRSRPPSSPDVIPSIRQPSLINPEA